MYKILIFFIAMLFFCKEALAGNDNGSPQKNNAINNISVTSAKNKHSLAKKQQKDKTKVGHQKIEPCSFDGLFLLGFRQDELPTREAHQLPEKQEYQSIGGNHNPNHRNDEGDIVQQIMRFSSNMGKISVRIEQIRYRSQNDQCGKDQRECIKLKHFCNRLHK